MLLDGALKPRWWCNEGRKVRVESFVYQQSPMRCQGRHHDILNYELVTVVRIYDPESIHISAFCYSIFFGQAP